MHPSFFTTPEYHDWQWALYQALREAIESSYGQREEMIIKAMTDVSQDASISNIPMTSRTKISSESAFLHGSKFQVKFNVGKMEYQRELADLLVLGTFVKDGKLIWQRVCFIQAKKGKSSSAKQAQRFEIDEGQLSLLRAFPKFKGISGIFKGEEKQLVNESGMLGAYGFLTEPGEFTVLSARLLHTVLGGRKWLTGQDMLPSILADTLDRKVQIRSDWPFWPFDPEHCPECRDILDHWLLTPWRYFEVLHSGRHTSKFPHGHDFEIEPVPTRLAFLDLNEFVIAWTSLKLGEVWTADSTAQKDIQLRDCIIALTSYVSNKYGGLKQLGGLFHQGDIIPPQELDVKISDNEGGLGILSTVVTVNEG